MQLSPAKTPRHSPKIAHTHNHLFKTLTPKHTRRSSNAKHEDSIADLFIRKHRNLHLPLEHPVVDIELGFPTDEKEDTEVSGRRREGRLVYVAIAVFATLGMGAWLVSLGIAMGVVDV
jgi:hypothetical protein